MHRPALSAAAILAACCVPAFAITPVAEEPAATSYLAEQVMKPIPPDAPGVEKLPSVGLLTAEGAFICNVFAVTETHVAVASYCVAEAELGGLAVVRPGDAAMFAVTDVVPLENMGDLPADTDPLLGNLSLLVTGPHGLVPIAPGNVRRPVVGETVMAVGYSDLEYFRQPAPNPAGEGLNVAPFIAEACTVVAVDEAAGFFTTDCVTAPGTSTSPIFSATDGMLLGAVAWGPVDQTYSPFMDRAYEAMEEKVATP
jgi:hypothetical protein